MGNKPWLVVAAIIGRDPIFEEGEYYPIAITVEAVVEAVGAVGQIEGKKKKRKKNMDCHRVGLIHRRVHIIIVIWHAWMMWFVLNVEEKNYWEYYIPGANERV
ncbi:hypothetical protein R1flu_015297 [Riccia fluitans]|uniref:Uncharacterized protein n=1 Tax=Riccia fluitans TaxID=41844 RepID=A0ABD1YIK6_9MARC